MAIKKSELYSSLWQSCDKLRGSMEPSQYKDYVLVFLFVKYVSDKYADDPDGIITIPKGGGFKYIQSLKGQKDIGEKIDAAITKLAKANDLVNVIDSVVFQDEEKLGKGQNMIDTLTGLITIFENPSLDFSKNRADGDDILGDAYEYLMRHFASESGKSKGEFYTPGEVSRVLAKVIGVKYKTKEKQTIYDPTCGSGSLLLKVAEEADNKVNLFGQEKTAVTAALARMNMILHNNPEAEIQKGESTLSNPLFLDDKTGQLQTFDFVVANPPFSSKNWMDGFNPSNDIYKRFDEGKIPPTKNGDYAFLLHIIKSLKRNGKGACILPHGVLFRGNVEAEIRKDLIESGYIKGIIGLPGNLFYGTGIPACVIVIDMENAHATKDLSPNKKGIFMIDASKGFMKDGNKNRLREQDIHRIVDVFNNQKKILKYSRFVSLKEISDPKNDYNLNIPRYIDNQEPEDIQDIEAHLLGDIPNIDVENLNGYWKVYKTMKSQLFSKSTRSNYSKLKVSKEEINKAIYSHPEFISFSKVMDQLFNNWSKHTSKFLKSLTSKAKPKQTIFEISEGLLKTYTDKELIDKYDVYQHLLNYWNEIMQDDSYQIALDGWKADLSIIKQTKAGIVWDCDLVPKYLVTDRYFSKEKKEIEQLELDKENVNLKITDLDENIPENVEEDDWILNEVKNSKGKITIGLIDEKIRELQIEILKIPTSKNKNDVTKIIKDKFKKEKPSKENQEQFDKLEILNNYLLLVEEESKLKSKIKDKNEELDKKLIARYETLTQDEIKQLVVDDKWMTNIERNIKTEMERISQRLTQRIKELAERYETRLPDQTTEVAKLENKVNLHLKKMGFSWS
jgi:type I restriction enzyme M protein